MFFIDEWLFYKKSVFIPLENVCKHFNSRGGEDAL